MTQFRTWLIAAAVAYLIALGCHLDPDFDVDQAVADDAAAAPADVASAARAERIAGVRP